VADPVELHELSDRGDIDGHHTAQDAARAAEGDDAKAAVGDALPGPRVGARGAAEHTWPHKQRLLEAQSAHDRLGLALGADVQVRARRVGANGGDEREVPHALGLSGVRQVGHERVVDGAETLLGARGLDRGAHAAEDSVDVGGKARKVVGVVAGEEDLGDAVAQLRGERVLDSRVAAGEGVHLGHVIPAGRQRKNGLLADGASGAGDKNGGHC